MEGPGSYDRRKLKRRSLSYYMLVLDARTRQSIGHLVDITPLGLLMDSPQPLILEQNFRLRLDITPDLGEGDHITFIARSKWCTPDAQAPFLYDVGFSIVEITPHDAAILKRISEKYSARDGDSFPLN